jgi:hypothetical protein
VAARTLIGVSCGSSTSSEAAGFNSSIFAAGVIIGTTNRGATWTAQTVPVGVSNLRGMSCVSATTCEVGGWNSSGTQGLALGTTNANAANGGATWTTQPLPSGVVLNDEVGCASATVCEAVGTNHSKAGIARTTNGGGTWKPQTAPSSAAQLFGVACASPTICEAVGSTASNLGVAIGTTNGGADLEVTDPALALSGGSVDS